MRCCGGALEQKLYFLCTSQCSSINYYAAALSLSGCFYTDYYNSLTVACTLRSHKREIYFHTWMNYVPYRTGHRPGRLGRYYSAWLPIDVICWVCYCNPNREDPLHKNAFLVHHNTLLVSISLTGSDSVTPNAILALQ